MKKIKTKSISKSKIEPLFDRVLVKTVSADEYGKNKFGIIIPETVGKEKPEQGIVVAIGKGKYDNGALIPMSVKVGDKIIFSKYGYDEIKIGSEEYLILREDNILAILN